MARVAEVLLCEPWLVHRMARKMPELLSMERMALARRLLLLKVRDLHVICLLCWLCAFAWRCVIENLFLLAVGLVTLA